MGKIQKRNRKIRRVKRKISIETRKVKSKKLTTRKK